MEGHSKPDIYYDRVMCDNVLKLFQPDGEFHWVIDYVKQYGNELDFQTGKNYISIYRGTGRICTINKNGKVRADKKYMDLHPILFEGEMNAENLGILLNKVREVKTLDRYYVDSKGNKKEGYFQNLISRRYSFELQDNDDFVIFDKEFALGYASDKIKEEINKPIIEWGNIKANELEKLEGFPSNIKRPGSECDFIAVTKDGSIFLLELKRSGDSQKIYLAPFQVAMYGKLINKYIESYWENFKDAINNMISQKIKLGLISSDWKQPELKKEIRYAVVIGQEDYNCISGTVINKFNTVKNLLEIPVEVYKCDRDGTLLKSYNACK